MTKYSIAIVLVGLGTVACRSHPTVYAETEGPRVGERPPLLSPGRTGNAALQSLNRGALVVKTAIGYEPGPAAVAVSALAGSKRTFERTTSATGVAAFDGLDPGEYVVSARRVGLRPQTVRVAIAAGYTDTLQFSLGQP